MYKHRLKFKNEKILITLARVDEHDEDRSSKIASAILVLYLLFVVVEEVALSKLLVLGNDLCEFSGHGL